MEAPVHLVVGLGNPGDRYRFNRHNLGFWVVEELARRLGISFRSDGGSYSVAAGDGVVLLKPLTYMNLSGEAVEAWSHEKGINVTGSPLLPPVEGDDTAEGEEAVGPEIQAAVRPLVVCDDLSLPLGSLRLRGRGSSGGQNGLESVIEHLGGEEFPRMRLGIAPLDRFVDPAQWPDHVLADFDGPEKEAATDLVLHAADAVEFWLANGLDATVSRFNRRIRPEPGSAE